MSTDVPSRMFANSTSYQYGDQLTRVTTMVKSTYVLDRVTDKGATFRVTTSSRHGSRKPDVAWVVVTPQRPQMQMHDTRKSARARIEG